MLKVKINRKFDQFLCRLGAGLCLDRAQGDSFYISREKARSMGGLTLFSLLCTMGSLLLFYDVCYSGHPLGIFNALMLGGVLGMASWYTNAPGTRGITKMLRQAVFLSLVLLVSYGNEFVAFIPDLSQDLSHQSVQNEDARYRPVDSLDGAHQKAVSEIRNRLNQTSDKLNWVVQAQSKASSLSAPGTEAQQKTVLRDLSAHQRYLEEQTQQLQGQLEHLNTDYDQKRKELILRTERQLSQDKPQVTALTTDAKLMSLKNDPILGISYERLSRILLGLAILSEAIFGFLKLTERKNFFEHWALDREAEAMRLRRAAQGVREKEIRLYEQLSETALANKDYAALAALEEQLRNLGGRSHV